jgi:hypothetical protein
MKNKAVIRTLIFFIMLTLSMSFQMAMAGDRMMDKGVMEEEKMTIEKGKMMMKEGEMMKESDIMMKDTMK